MTKIPKASSACTSQQAYLRLADGSERIIDLPSQNAMGLADTPGSYGYGDARIVKYVHSSCKEFSKLVRRLSNVRGGA